MLKKKTITFLKDAAGWYADVKEKTRAQNSMVLGADKLCEAMAEGQDNVSVEFSFTDNKKEAPAEFLLRLHRVEHDPFGATYHLSGPSADAFKIPFIWICNVTHCVTDGEHPKYIFVHSIEKKVPIVVSANLD